MSSIESILQKYLNGTSTEVENKYLHEWIQQSEENQRRFLAEKDIWDYSGYHADRSTYNIDAELKVFQQQRRTQPVGTRSVFPSLLKIAAILLLTFGLGWGTRFLPVGTDDIPTDMVMQEIIVPKGQVSQIFLADGTRIWINSASRINLPSVFPANERSVRLSGEAFFEVARDARRPFIVETDGQRIEVLGTSFNIRAYPGSKEIQTTLATGQIKLSAGKGVVRLNPGDQSQLNRVTGQLTLQKVDPSNFISWRKGRFEFQNEDLIEVFKVAERWYDVDIEYDTVQFKGMRFSGVIKRNKEIQHFLNLLNLSIPIRYEIERDKITISQK